MDCILSVPLIIKINKCKARWFPSNPNTACTKTKHENCVRIIGIKWDTSMQHVITCIQRLYNGTELCTGPEQHILCTGHIIRFVYPNNVSIHTNVSQGLSPVNLTNCTMRHQRNNCNNQSTANYFWE